MRVFDKAVGCDARSGFRFAGLGHARGADAIVVALEPEYIYAESFSSSHTLISD
jgi:hypothetical protein